MEKIVVIGGSGFMGSHVADELTTRGYEVVIYDAKPSKWANRNQKTIVGELLDLDSLKKHLRGAQCVYHYAGIADIGEASDNPTETIKDNVLGTTHVLQACVEEKVKRLIYASTMYVYSNTGSFYRASKQASEIIIEAYNQKFGLEYTILRYGSLYGPRSQSWNGLTRYVTQAVKEGRIVYNGTGKENREYINVLDAAKLSVNALSDQYKNMSLTITGTQVLTSSQLLTMIKEIVGKDIEIIYTGKPSDFHYEMTPYRYTPKPARKLVSSEFIDIGQGVLNLVEDIHSSDNHHNLLE